MMMLIEIISKQDLSCFEVSKRYYGHLMSLLVSNKPQDELMMIAEKHSWAEHQISTYLIWIEAAAAYRRKEETIDGKPVEQF